MARKKGKRSRDPLPLDAYLTFAIFAGVGLATWGLDQLLRMTLLWVALLALLVVYASGRRVQFACSFSGIGRGTLAGLLISVPLVLLARGFFRTAGQRLLPIDNTLALFWGLVLVMVPLEASFFRGLLQREKGLWAAVLLYAAAIAIYFMPSTTGDHVLVLVALTGGLGLLGFIYSYVCTLYGFAASLACQGIVHFVLLILPLLPQEIAGLLA